MPNYKVLGTDHMAFTVSDMDRSVKMFCDVMGFTVVSDDRAGADLLETLTGIPAPVRYVYLRGPDNHQVELVQYFGPADRVRVQSRPCDTAAAHIAMRVDNVPAAVDAAKRAGMVPYSKILSMEDSSGRIESAYMRDPDGLTI
ncbi:MAG: VOC family protein, partial [Betaproteobacteria bacterium]|nr:VOC family protein [Betaproteobacteria bacterium]